MPTDNERDCGCGGSQDAPERGLSRAELLRRGIYGAASAAALSGLGFPSAAAAGLDRLDARPKRGGRLRVGFVGGGTTETLDPRGGLADVDIARAYNLYQRLTDFDGPRGSLRYTLAETIEPLNKTARDWIVRVKPDVEWHNGKTLGADDVIYTFKMILDPKNKLGGASDLSFIDPTRMKKVDKRTVRLHFVQPIADPRTSFGSRLVPIIQDGFTDFAHPVGTGPFRFSSWTPGVSSLLTKFPNYHEHGLPYVDELQTIDIKDDTARLNALKSGQIDAMQSVALADLPSVANSQSIHLLSCAGGACIPIVMDCTQAPFTDVRVRQAFRLIADRHQLVTNVLGGYGTIGNDLFSPFDALYDHKIPQRQHDPAQARALLSAAGQQNLTVTLYTSPVGTGYVETAQAFAQQAKAAGVTVNVQITPTDTYFSQYYLKVPFYMINWGYWPLDEQFALSCYSKASYNEQHFDDPQFDALWKKARATINITKRKAMYAQLQKILWNQGGYIVWGFQDFTDAYSAKTHGWQCSPSRPLGFYGFKRVWLS